MDERRTVIAIIDEDRAVRELYSLSPATDAIDRMVRFRVTGSGVREALVNERIACLQHAYEFGIDRPDLTDWKWPF